MRHNPAAGEIIIMLRCLKVRGMAQAVGEQSNEALQPSRPRCRSCRSS
jgi:hypothetical protein